LGFGDVRVRSVGAAALRAGLGAGLAVAVAVGVAVGDAVGVAVAVGDAVGTAGATVAAGDTAGAVVGAGETAGAVAASAGVAASAVPPKPMSRTAGTTRARRKAEFFTELRSFSVSRRVLQRSDPPPSEETARDRARFVDRISLGVAPLARRTPTSR
jgi:hypothetical protein